MSKFWGGDSSEEEEEEEDFFSESEESGDEEDKPDPASRAGRWVQGAAYGSDDEEEKREVRAKHERVNDSMEKSIEAIRTAMEENNWNTIAKGKSFISFLPFIFLFFFCTRDISVPVDQEPSLSLLFLSPLRATGR